ncbi:RsmB/NOP family class I SAM-dependent RNA methyltransferase [Archaeoglobus neptunius]|uniref:RsmB/NOP family class I SAM-dependent RNA methyltransferase n=1 Tax=Archaeoglobus neptunius TaxID=2798580 RepID=UPI002ED8E35F
MIPTQEIAADVLTLVEERRISIKTAVARVAGRYDYKIRGSVHAYSIETLRRLNAIDHFLRRTVPKFDLLNPFIKNLLRIAVYEMKYKDVHPALATDSAVRIVKKRNPKLVGLVNGVLRNVEKLEIDAENDIERISLNFFHPEWFVKYTIELLGKDEALELIRANLRQPPAYIRVNELKGSIEGVLRYLENRGVRLSPTFMDEVFRVESYSVHPASFDWHAEGKYVIQDLASCFVSHALNPEPGDVVVDLAAAPGMKTSHIAMLMENRGRIIAVDNSEERIKRMKSKIKQLGVKNVEIKLGDGCRFSFMADKALVDAPCSSTGSYASQPNVKWSFDWRKFEGTVAVQRKMLKNALNGADEVVYSTCSIMFEENEGNLNAVGARVVKLDSPFSRGIKEFRGEVFRDWNRVVRSFPHLHNSSGFFISKLKGDER